MDYREREKIAELIKELRGDSSLRDYAKVLGVNYTTVRSWENGDTFPQLEYLEKIAHQLDWSLPKLYYYLKGEKPAFDQVRELAFLLSQGDRFKLSRDLLDSLSVAS